MKIYSGLLMGLMGISILACSKSDDIEILESLEQTKVVGNVQLSNIRLKFEEVTQNANFIGNAKSKSLVYDDKIWLFTENKLNNQGIFASTDGINWDNTDFPYNRPNNPLPQGTDSSVPVIYKNEIWVIGGKDTYNSCESQWDCPNYLGISHSADGWNWQSFSFLSSVGQTATVFHNTLWTHGGYRYGEVVTLLEPFYNNYAYGTSDGEHWFSGNNLTNSFTPRAWHTTTLFKDRLWIIGGRNDTGALNDVWSSLDGSSWNLVNPSRANRFPARSRHTTISYKDKLWVIGGYSGYNVNSNDIWYSDNGDYWIKAILPSAFSSMNIYTATVFKGKIWIMGATDSNSGQPGRNQVWTIELED